MNQGTDSTVSDQYIRWWENMLHSVPSVAMKQLWGEDNYHTELDDMMKEKAVTKGTKIMNVLEMLKEPSVHPQLYTMLLLLLSLQLCGLSAVEYSLYPTKSLWFQLVTFLWICVTRRACLCLWSSVDHHQHSGLCSLHCLAMRAEKLFLSTVNRAKVLRPAGALQLSTFWITAKRPQNKRLHHLQWAPILYYCYCSDDKSRCKWCRMRTYHIHWLCFVFKTVLISQITFYTSEIFQTANLHESIIPYVALGVAACELISVIFCVSQIMLGL